MTIKGAIITLAISSIVLGLSISYYITQPNILSPVDILENKGMYALSLAGILGGGSAFGTMLSLIIPYYWKGGKY